MLKFTYKLGWSIVCATVFCALALAFAISIVMEANLSMSELVVPAVCLGSIFGFADTVLIAMAEDLGFWSSKQYKPHLVSGITFGVLLGFCISGLGLITGLSLGVWVMVATATGCWFGTRIAAVV
jgi:hypothetical protein